MNEPTPVMDSSPANAPSPQLPIIRRDQRWRAPLAVALVIVVFLGWQLLDTRAELRGLREDVAHRLGEASATGSETRQIARTGQDAALALQGRVSALEARLVDSESQQLALEKIYQEFSRSRDERALQEVEQAVSIASQQLQLGGNVPAALSALQAADAQLARIDQPRLLPLRKLVTRDIDRLRTLPLADVSGMALQLDANLARIDALPLAFEHAPTVPTPVKPATNAVSKPVAKPARAGAKPAPVASAPVAEVPEPGFGDRMAAVAGDLWNDFRQLVRIERLDKPEAALLAPSQAAYLRENIRLRLLSARLALLQRDGRVFAEDTQQARLWLEKYFDTSARSVASMIEELRQMESAKLVVELPQLTETEAALRRLRLSR